MIPNNISREDILMAIEEMDKSGIPKRRKQKRYALEYDRSYYPPKYSVSLANRYANGYELDSCNFSGGKETNEFLEERGFKIARLDKPGSKFLRSSECVAGSEEGRPDSPHSARCPRCKESVYLMLSQLYSRVERSYQLKLGADIKDYENSPYYSDLKKIYDALRGHRGYLHFVRTSLLPQCDFFIPNPGFIVEYDEKQHFSRAREISLELYPRTLELGFNRERWAQLCREINAKDNDPDYRDEQRAWYDTLRDFAPVILGLRPTIRLFDEDRAWCEIDPSNRRDLAEFEEIITQRPGRKTMEIRKDVNPFFARVIISGPWNGEISEARSILGKICDAWPKNSVVKFLMTCGGFIQFEWPRMLTRKEIGDNLNPPKEAREKLFRIGSRCAKQLLEGRLRERLSQYADYLTLGVDSSKDRISMTQTPIGYLHCELVFIIGLKTGEIHYTGKSYPTNSQQPGLLRISDLQSHFLELKGIGKTMILGCHDLAIYSPRSANAKGWRRQLNAKFRDLALKEKPIVLLHHPHTADAVMTWVPMWSGLQKKLLSVNYFAGAGRYFRKEGPPRSGLYAVLRANLRGDSIDFIFQQ